MIEATAGIQSYLKQIGRNRVLTKDEEVELFTRLRAGDESVRQEIIACNLRLVVRLAQRFRNKGIALDDLVQEGNIGLMEVIDRFDPTLGFRFSTYAAFWIRQAMQVAVRKQGSLIRLPVRKARLLGRMNEVIHDYMSTEGRMPTHAEMAGLLDVTEESVADLTQMSRTTLSLDTPYDEDGGTLGERIADEQAVGPHEESMRRELVRRVHAALAHLNERETSILGMRFGLKGQTARSLRKISARVGLSQEGVRRVEQRALAKLGRAHLRSQLAGLL